MRVMCSGVSMPPDMVPCESDERKVRATFIALPPNKMHSTIMLAHQPSCAHATRACTLTGAHAAARLPVSGLRLELDTIQRRTTVKHTTAYNHTTFQPYNHTTLQTSNEASDATPKYQTNGVCSRPPMPVRRKRSVRFRIGFLPGAGGVPMGTVHKGPCSMQRHTTTTKKIDPNATVLVKSRVHVKDVRLLVCDARVSCASCVLAKTRDLARREHSHAHGVGERVRPNRKEAAI
jgi:hypothetical protein